MHTDTASSSRAARMRGADTDTGTSRPAGGHIPARPGQWLGAPPPVVARVQAAFDAALDVWRAATADLGDVSDQEAVGLSDALISVQRHLQAAPDRLLGEIEDRGICYRGHTRSLASWLQQRYQLHPTDAHLRAKAAHAPSYDLTQPASHRSTPGDQPDTEQNAAPTEPGGHTEQAEQVEQTAQPGGAGDGGDTSDGGDGCEPIMHRPRPARPGDQLAKARAAGELSDRQHELVLDALRHIPATVNDAARMGAEAELLELVVRVGPSMFRDRAELIIDALDPYAAREIEKRAEANRGLTIGRTREGLATLKGQLTRPAAALLRTVLHPGAAPETDRILGERTYQQRNHDAFHAWLRGLVPDEYTYDARLDRMTDPHSTAPPASPEHTPNAASGTDAAGMDGVAADGAATRDDTAAPPADTPDQGRTGDQPGTARGNTGIPPAGATDHDVFAAGRHRDHPEHDADTGTTDTGTTDTGTTDTGTTDTGTTDTEATIIGAANTGAPSTEAADQPVIDAAGQLGLFARPGRDMWRHILASSRADNRDTRAHPPGPANAQPTQPPDPAESDRTPRGRDVAPGPAEPAQPPRRFDTAAPLIGIGSHRGLPARLLIVASLEQLIHGTGLLPTIQGGHVRVEDVLADLHHMCVNVLATDGDGAPLRLGRTRRTATTIQRLVLAARDGGCVIPDCEQPARYTDAHHIRPWANGGDTDIDNLALLCRHHHRTIGDWQLTYHRGRIWATPANEPHAIPQVNTTWGYPSGPPPGSRPARGAA